MIRQPHTTPSTIVTHWEAKPYTLYSGECNVDNCSYWAMQRERRDKVVEQMRNHQRDRHGIEAPS